MAQDERYGRIIGQVRRVTGNQTEVSYWEVRCPYHGITHLFRDQEVSYTALFGSLRIGDLVRCTFREVANGSLWFITAKLDASWRIWRGSAHKTGLIKDSYPDSKASINILDESSLELVGPKDWAWDKLRETLPEANGWVKHCLMELVCTELPPYDSCEPASTNVSVTA